MLPPLLIIVLGEDSF